MHKNAKEKDAVAYDVPVLVIAPEQPVAVTGNYEAIEKTLQKWKEQVSSMKLTEGNLDEVQTVKKAAVAVRNNLDRVVDGAKKALFNDPKRIFEARVKPLYNLVADVEGAADAVLSKLEDQRINEVNQVLDHYKGELQEKYQLTAQFLLEINYPENFYNKTTPKGYSSMDKFWKESLEAQFIEAKKKQDALGASIRLIEKACADEPRLNVQHWVEQMWFSDVAVTLEKIAAEKERLHELDQDSSPTRTVTAVEAEVVDASEQSTEETKKIILGIPTSLDFSTDFPGRMKSMKIELVYPCDLVDALNELFKELKAYGIKWRPLKEEVVF